MFSARETNIILIENSKYVNKTFFCKTFMISKNIGWKFDALNLLSWL